MDHGNSRKEVNLMEAKTEASSHESGRRIWVTARKLVEREE